MGKSFTRVKEMFKPSNIFLLGPRIVTGHWCHGAMNRWYYDSILIKKFDTKTLKISYTTGTILHFMIKTREEFQSKVNRGRGDGITPRHTDSFFQNYDLNDIQTEIDGQIIEQLKNGINQITDLIGNYKEIVTQTSFFTTLESQLMSIGLSDIGNHKLVSLIYRLVKKNRKLMV